MRETEGKQNLRLRNHTFAGSIWAWVCGFCYLGSWVCCLDLPLGSWVHRLGSWFLFWSLTSCDFCFNLLFFLFFFFFFFFFFSSEEEEEDLHIFWFLGFLSWDSSLRDSIFIEIESFILEMLLWTRVYRTRDISFLNNL